MLYIALNNSPKYGGGVEQVVKNLVINFCALKRKSVTLICNDINEGHSFFFEGFTCVNLAKGRSSRLSKLLFLNRLAFSWRVFKYLRQNASSNDAVVIQGIEYAFFPSLFRVCLPRGLKLIAHVHGSSFEEVTDLVFRLPLKKFGLYKALFYFARWYFYVIDKVASLKVDGFIFINNHSQSYFLKRFICDGKKTKVIYNCPDAATSKVRPLGSSSKELNALIIGSTAYRKGLDIAIEAVSLAHESGVPVRLTILGFSDIGAVLNTSTMPSYISYVGRVPPSEVAKYHTTADFLLLPSRHEGWPLVVLDSLRTGNPVIASPTCKFSELNGNEEMGYILKDYSVAACREAISLMCKNNQIATFQAGIDRHKKELDQFEWQGAAADFERFVVGI